MVVRQIIEGDIPASTLQQILRLFFSFVLFGICIQLVESPPLVLGARLKAPRLKAAPWLQQQPRGRSAAPDVRCSAAEARPPHRHPFPSHPLPSNPHHKMTSLATLRLTDLDRKPPRP